MKQNFLKTLITAIAAFAVSLSATAQSGTCGDNLTWAYSIKKLTISGTGAMTNYTTASAVPWSQYSSLIASVSLPEGLTSLSPYALMNCRRLPSITLPESLTQIGTYAFANDTSLTAITIPAGVTDITLNPFGGCCNLQSMSVASGNTKYDSREGCNAIIETATNTLVAGCQNSVIPATVTAIGDEAFRSCTELTSVTIPASVSSIGAWAFNGCNNLTSVTVKSATPATIAAETFTKFEGATLYVPTGSRAAYAAADYWKNFETITELQTCGDNLTWAYSIKKLTISGTGAMTNYTTASAVPWSQYSSLIASVSLPEGLTSLSPYALMNCRRLPSITLPESLTQIGTYAFANDTSLTAITIPAGVTDITLNPFGGCCNLQSMSVASGNTKYDSREGCNAIIETATNTLVAGCQNTVIPATVTAIGIEAFSGFTKLESITIPASVTSIGEDAFRYCTSLTSVTVLNPVPATVRSNTFPNATKATLYVPAGAAAAYQNTNYWKNFGSIQEMPGGQCGDNLYWQLAGDRLVITGTGAMTSYSAASAQPWASYRDQITSLSLPEGMTTIGNYAFAYFANLNAIALPSSLTRIGNSAFSQCANVPAVTLHEGLTYIGSFAFGTCTGLTAIHLPSTVTSLGSNPFSGCANIETITVDPNNTRYDAREGCNAIIRTSSNELVSGCAASVIPSSVKRIGYGAFNNVGLESVTLPEGLTYIDTFAFRFAKITSVVIPASVTTIGDTAFGSCEQLASVTLPPTLTSFSPSAFIGCKSLKTIQLPETLTSLSSQLFQATGLESITIPAGVTSIGEDAFRYCTSLTSVTVLNPTPVAITLDTFSQFEGATLCVPAGSSAAYAAADNWKNFGTIVECGTCGENLTWQLNGNRLIITGTGAMTNYTYNNKAPWYASCASITRVSLPDGLTTIGDYAFRDLKNLTSIDIPSTVTSLGSRAFEGCGLTSVDVPASVTTMGSAFYACQQLASVTLHEGLTTIGNSGFFDCKALTSITLPSTLTTLNGYAFSNCSALTEVIALNPTPITIANTVFPTSRTEATLIVPRGSLSAYEAANIWKEFGTIRQFAYDFVEDGIYYQITTDETVSVTHRLTGEGSYSGDVIIPATVTHDGTTYNVTRIYANAFSNSGLTSITLPEGIVAIGNNAFLNCGGLTAITIPASVTSLSNNVFVGCQQLTDYTVLSATPAAIQGNTFPNCANATLTVPYGSKADYEAADYWKEFKTIQEPGGQCGDNLYWQLADNRLIITGTGAMYDYNSNTQPWKSYRNLITRVSLPEGMTYLGQAAFYGCRNLTSVTLPESVTEAGQMPFWACTSLTQPVYNSKLFVFMPYAYEGSYTLPSTIETINHQAFAYCRNLTSVKIPEGVTIIGTQAFWHCESLTSITIPQSVGEIGYYAFDECPNLTTVIMKNPTPVLLIEGTFTDHSIVTVYVPAGSRAAYVADENWTGFKAIIEMGDANHDHTVSITDVGLMIDRILGSTPAGFDAVAADVNQDGTVSITDVGLVIDAILSQGSAGVKQRRPAVEAIEDMREPQ